MLPARWLHRHRSVRRHRRRLLHEAARRRRRRGRSKSKRQKEIRCAGGRHREPRSRQATTARCSASSRARSTASSSILTNPTMWSLLRGLLARRMRWCGRAGQRSSRIDEFAPAALHRRLSPPDRHVDHSVRPRGAVGGQTRNRVHRAGVVGRRDRPRVGARRTAHRCSSRGRSASGWRARLPQRARWLSQIRPRRRLDARGADPLSHLLFGVLHRCAGPTVPRPSPAHHSRRRDGGRRPGGAGLRHRTAMVRPVRHDRPRRVDRRGVATCPSPNRPTSTPNRSTSGCARTASTTSLTCPPPSGFPTRRSETAPTSPRSTNSPNEARSSPIRATGSRSPVRPTARTPSLVRTPQPAPRLGEHTDALPLETRHQGRETRADTPGMRFAGIAVRGSAGPRHDEFLGRAVVHARAGAAGRRGHPRGVDGTSRRHPVDRGRARSPRTSGGSVRRSSRA